MRKDAQQRKGSFQKAYKHVDWGFLDHVLERKGFGFRWRTWMRLFVYGKFCNLGEWKCQRLG